MLCARVSGGLFPGPSFTAAARGVLPRAAFSSPYSDLLALMPPLLFCFPGLKADDEALFTGVSAVA